jgi:hypothetical protein
MLAHDPASWRAMRSPKGDIRDVPFDRSTVQDNRDED